MVRNERFRVALDYLYKNGLVADQRELSEKIGVSEFLCRHIWAAHGIILQRECSRRVDVQYQCQGKGCRWRRAG